jgi:selenocysteine lyase/cysteine desulfurase
METDDASSMGAHDYALRADAGRFEVGSYNLAAAYAVDASLEMLLELTPAAIERRVLEKADALRETLHALGAPGVTMPDAAARSGIVTAGPLDAGGHGASETAWVVAASAALNEAKVAHTIRRGQLRFGVHAYNDATDVARVADVLRAMRPAA